MQNTPIYRLSVVLLLASLPAAQAPAAQTSSAQGSARPSEHDRTYEAQSPVTGFLDRSLELDGSANRYQIYVPREFDGAEAWPIILYLHGAGERGTDGLFQTEIGLGSAIRRYVDRYPAIVVFPQVPPGSNWIETADVAMATLAATEEEFSTDPDRVYLTGLSMGGNGTWHLAYSYPDRWAAVVPICGWIVGGERWPSVIPSSTEPYETVAEAIADLPVWIFHGEDDRTIPVEESRKMEAALREQGADVRFSEFLDTAHNAWDPAYRSPSLPEWLFKQQRR